jgi:hypothetical protein
MADSVLNAIRDGEWAFEPTPVKEDQFESTGALPGSKDKVRMLAERAKEGLPLWHSEDRQSFDDSEEAMK